MAEFAVLRLSGQRPACSAHIAQHATHPPDSQFLPDHLFVSPACSVVDHSQAIPATQEIVQTATVDLGGRKMLSSRKTLGVDGDGVQVMIDPTQNVYSRFPYKHCPTTNLPWADQSAYSDAANYTMYGDLVHDAGICLVSGNGVGKVNTTTNSTGIVSALALATADHVMFARHAFACRLILRIACASAWLLADQ